MKQIILIITYCACSLLVHAQNSELQIKVYKNKIEKNSKPKNKKSSDKLYTTNKETEKETDGNQIQSFTFSYDKKDVNKLMPAHNNEMFFYFNSENFNKDMAALNEKMGNMKFDFDEKKLNERLSNMNKRLEAYDFQNKNNKIVIIQNEKQSPKKDLFERLGSNKNITTVYISKTMLNMASSFAPDMGNIKTKDISKKLEQLEIYTSDTKDACRIMKDEVATFSRNKNYEVLMRIKDGFDDVTFYGVKDGNAFKEMIMITMEDDECSIIRMVGTFTAEDVKKVAANK